jgi:hypothetical protein
VRSGEAKSACHLPIPGRQGEIAAVCHSIGRGTARVGAQVILPRRTPTHFTADARGSRRRAATHKEGFSWGAGFSGDREDAMHFKASDELVRRWDRDGLLG